MFGAPSTAPWQAALSGGYDLAVENHRREVVAGVDDRAGAEASATKTTAETSTPRVPSTKRAQRAGASSVRLGHEQPWQDRRSRLRAPPELPVLLLAPPRMGKSALIWLMTSFGVKLGARCFLDSLLTRRFQWTRCSVRPRAAAVDAVDGQGVAGAQQEDPVRHRRRRAVGSFRDRTPAQQAQVSSRTSSWAVRQEASSNGGVFTTRLAPRGAAASNVTGKPRKTQQGLEVAVPWTIQDIPMDPSNPANPNKHAEEAIWRRIGINGAYYSPDQNREGNWTEASLSSVETVATKAYASKMQRLDNWWPNQVGTTYKMMRSGADHARTHVFMYSHHTTDDALAAEKAIDILRSPDQTRWEDEAGLRSEDRFDEWVLHIRDEAQYLCQSAIDNQKFPEMGRTCPWIFQPPGYGGSGRAPTDEFCHPR